MTLPEELTSDLVTKYINKFNNDDRAKLPDLAINQLLKKFPNNDSLEGVLLKVVAINSLYSTNIYDTIGMARHINSIKNLDNYLEDRKSEVVGCIANGHHIISGKSKKEITFYSFATKYCSFHKSDYYSIYDQFVGGTLIAYRDSDKKQNFKTKDLRNYSTFQNIVSEFRTLYCLNHFTLKEIDNFLWMYGKEMDGIKKKAKKASN